MKKIIEYAGTYRDTDFYRNEYGSYCNKFGDEIFMPMNVLSKLRYSKKYYTIEIEEDTDEIEGAENEIKH